MQRPRGLEGRLQALTATLLVACGPGVSDDDDELADGSGGALATEGGESQESATGADGADGDPGVPDDGSDPTEGDPGTTTGDPSPTTGDPGVPLPDGCQCSAAEGFTCDDLATTACDGRVLCPTITRECSRPSADIYACDAEYEYDEEALDCGLTALRDRTVGKIEIAVENTICGLEGCGVDRFRIAIRGQDVAVVDSCPADPLGPDESTGTLRQLAEPAHFEACRASPSAAMRYECIFDGLSDDVTVCAAG